MAAVSDTTKAWLPDEGFLSNPTVMSLIKDHIKAYMIQLASSDMAVNEDKFLGPFSTMVVQFERSTDPSKKMEELINFLNSLVLCHLKFLFLLPPLKILN